MTTKKLYEKYGSKVDEVKERFKREPELRVKAVLATSGSKGNITIKYNKCIKEIIEQGY